MSSRPDLTALEILVLVAETGSLGAAARRVGMAQPNASRALARLERQLGLTLVVRTPAGSRVTN
jgi:DNA-binding transcriptional LysR family regulator